MTPCLASERTEKGACARIRPSAPEAGFGSGPIHAVSEQRVWGDFSILQPSQAGTSRTISSMSSFVLNGLLR